MKPRLDLNWLLAPLLSLFAVAPLARPGYFWGAHDARHSVYFLVEFDRAIRDGVLYPRWMPDFNFGYGYPFFNIYPPGAFYVSEALHLAGLDFVDATKVVFALGVLLSGLTMYLFARAKLGRAAGLVAAVAYVYVPYRLADVYVRADLAESLTFVFLPLALWAFDRLADSRSPVHVAWGALAVAGLVFTHYPVGVLCMVLVAAYGVARFGLPRRPWKAALRPYGYALAAGVLGLGLGAIVLLPAVLEYNGVRTDQWAAGYYNYRDHFVYLFQLFSPQWGFGTSVPGPDDAMSFQLGVVPVVLAILTLFLPWARSAGAGSSLPAPAPGLVRFFRAAVLVVVFFMLPASAPLWDLSHLASFAQFPWRLLALAALPLAFLCGVVARWGVADGPGPETDEAPSAIPAWRPLAQAAPLIAVIVLASYPYLSPQIIEPAEGPVSLGGLMRFQQSANEMTGMTAWATAPRPPGWSPLADVFASGKEVTEKVAREGLPAGVQAVTTQHSSVADVVRVQAPAPFTLRFYTAYYPGWRAWVDGREVSTEVWGDLGGMAVAVPAGEHTVELHFGDTWPRLWGAIISAASLLALAAWLALAAGGRMAASRKEAMPGETV